MRTEVEFLSAKPMLGYGTTELRCMQPAAYLRAGRWRVNTGCVYESVPRASKVLVLHRVGADALVRRAIRIARAEGCRIVYDVDDLIFDVEGEEHLSSLRRHDGSQSLSARFREAMELCDVVTTSTLYLKQRINGIHQRCLVLRNGVSQALLNLSNGQNPSQVDRFVTLAYFSGSSHHDLDFALIQPALLKLLETEPSARLLLVGKLNYDDGFKRFGERFEYRKFMPYAEFIHNLGDADINLVPLQITLPFAQARSELKYIESGVFSVPTVASPTQTYIEALCNGNTGILCEDSDWYEVLVSLVHDKQRRTELGQAAREDVIRRYGPQVMEKDWHQFITDIQAMPVPENPVMFPSVLRVSQAGFLTVRSWRRWLHSTLR